MKLFNSRKKLIAAGISLVAVAGLATGAVAYFTSTGSGNGSATVGASGGLDIAQVGSVTGLVPNGPAKTIHYTVTNNNAGAEYVGQVTTTVTSVTSNTIVGDETCTPAMFSIVDGPALNTNLQPGGTASGTATIQLVDDNNNQDNCQNAPLVLHFASN